MSGLKGFQKKLLLLIRICEMRVPCIRNEAYVFYELLAGLK